MKSEFFWSVFFTVFFRLPVYKSIAAIFWQSASYVVFIYESAPTKKILGKKQLKQNYIIITSALFHYSPPPPWNNSSQNGIFTIMGAIDCLTTKLRGL